MDLGWGGDIQALDLLNHHGQLTLRSNSLHASSSNCQHMDATVHIHAKIFWSPCHRQNRWQHLLAAKTKCGLSQGSPQAVACDTL